MMLRFPFKQNFLWFVLGVLLFLHIGIIYPVHTQETVTPTRLPDQLSTPTPPPTRTPELQVITLTLFRDTDSLTLLIPLSDIPVSLTGLKFRVTLLNGQLISRDVDRDFPSFTGLPFGDINKSGSVCLRLIRANTREPVPLECNSSSIFTQQLSNSDIFWFDSNLVVEPPIAIWHDNTLLEFCAGGQSRCDFTLEFLPITPTPVAIETSDEIYYTTLVARARECPQLDCPILAVIEPNTAVVVTGSIQGADISENTLWRKATYEGREVYIHSSLLTRLLPPSPSSDLSVSWHCGIDSDGHPRVNFIIRNDGTSTSSSTYWQAQCVGGSGIIPPLSRPIPPLAVGEEQRESLGSLDQCDGWQFSIENRTSIYGQCGN